MQRLIRFLPLFFLTCLGRMLDSTELLTGNWDVQFHSPRWLILLPTKNRAFLPGRLQIYSNGTFHFHQSVFHMRGKWKIHSNPYCVTDRFYDEIVFTSYDRVQKEANRILQRGKFRMQCRLTGHFSPGCRLFRRQYGKGSLTRGLIIWEDLTNNNNNNKLCVCASFSAKRWIPSLSALYTNSNTSFIEEE